MKHRSTPRRNISAKSIVSPRRLWRATAPPGSPRPHESARRPKRRGERPPNDALISPPHPRRKSDARRTERKTIEKARKAKREGKAPTTQAGEYVRVEIDKIRRGEHGARSPEQAIAIGLSEARRAGVDLPPPKKGKVKETTRKSAEYAYEVGQHERAPTRRARGTPTARRSGRGSARKPSVRQSSSKFCVATKPQRCSRTRTSFHNIYARL